MLQKYDTAQQNFWTAFDSTSSLFTFLHKQITFTFLHLLINFQIYCSTAPVPDLCKEIDPENALVTFTLLHHQITFTFLHLLIDFQIYRSTEPVPELCKDVDPENPLCHFYFICISKPLSLSYICK